MKLSFFSVVLIAQVIILSFLTYSCDDDDVCMPDPNLTVATSFTTELAENHHSVYTDIVIDASQEEVWTVLTDWANMPNWSSSLQGLSGDIRDGGSVVATFIAIDPTTGDPLSIDLPHTLIYEEGVLFGWADPLALVPGITDNHLYRLEAISECQTRFIQTDEFQGTNPDFTTEVLATLSETGYNEFNAELKAEVEK